jgi:hypothetical protein
MACRLLWLIHTRWIFVTANRLMCLADTDVIADVLAYPFALA